MKKSAVYNNNRLMSNSRAFELWDVWQVLKDPKAKKAAKAALDAHMKALDDNEQMLLERYK